MKDKQAEVLFETTWRQDFDFMTADMRYAVYTFRVVGWSWLHDDGVRRLGALHYEQLTEDAMGNTVWLPMPNESVYPRVMAELLIKAGLLPPDTDLSDIGA